MKINFETIVIFLIVGFACLFLLRNWLVGKKKKCCGEKCGPVLSEQHKIR